MQILKYECGLTGHDLVEIFCRRPFGFALDSTLALEGLGDWSFFGSDPFRVIDGAKGMKYFSEVMREHHSDATCDIPFAGGAVGFFSYDYGRQLESLPNIAIDDLSSPPFLFGLYDGIIALNNQTKEVFLIASEIDQKAEPTFERLKANLAKNKNARDENEGFNFKDWKWNTSKSVFCDSVREIRSWIAKGDVYQVNLSRRRGTEFEGDIVALYQALRSGNPSPYSGFFNAGELQLISTSPEQFIKKQGAQLVTRPIKGTRPRGKDSQEDQLLADELEMSEKDKAELLMIVDLERNDMGRIAEYGSVCADTKFTIEYYQSVMHATAQVKGKLSPEKDIFDVINAMFPGGSITGAPKIRAMEIIETLEPNRRGIYCGSFGYIGFNQDAELNISIRTLQHVGGHLYYNVGSGIVWDSDPLDEYHETIAKGRAIEETLDQLC